MRSPGNVAAVLASAALAIAAAPARAQEVTPAPAVRFRGEAALSVGSGEAPMIAIGGRASASRRALLVEGSLDVGIYLDGSARQLELALLGGAGASLGTWHRWTGYALAVGGLHAIETDPGTGPEHQNHALPAIGARIGVRTAPPPRLGFLSLGVAAVVLVDLRRERDFFLGEDVGGVTALLTFTGGIGL